MADVQSSRNGKDQQSQTCQVRGVWLAIALIWSGSQLLNDDDDAQTPQKTRGDGDALAVAIIKTSKF